MQNGFHAVKHSAMAALSWVLLGFFLCQVRAETADPPHLFEQGHHFPAYGLVGDGGMAVADLDGDALSDVVFSGVNGQNGVGSAGSQLLFVMGRKSDSSVGLKQELLLDITDIHRVVAASLPDGTPTIVVVGKTGEVAQYAHWPLVRVGGFPVPTYPAAVLATDINADGIDELLVANASSLRCYSLSSGLLIWQAQLGSAIRSLVPAQLDADAALEILVGGDSGSTIVDGATAASHAGPARAFTSQTVFIPAIGMAASQFVYATSRGIESFAATPPWSIRWDYPLAIPASTLLAADVDFDGRNEVLYGDSAYNAGVHVLDPVSHGERFAIPGSDWNIASIAVADIDGDSVADLGFVTRSIIGSSTLGSRVRFVDAATGKRQHQVLASRGRMSVADLADLDADGSLEQVAVSTNNAGKGRIIIADAVTGSIRWDSGFGANNAGTPIDINASSIALGRLTPSGPVDILIGSKDYLGTKVMLVEGVSHAVKLRIGNNTVLGGRAVADVALFDFDRDGVCDIITLDSYTPLSAASTLHVFSASSGILMAETPLFGSSTGARRLVVGNVNSDQHPDLIAVLDTSVHAFDGTTLQPLWTIATPSSDGQLIAQGKTGAELMLFDGAGNITFHSVATGGLLRSIAVPTGMAAVVALGNETRDLLVASAGRLQVLDGDSGAVLASSERLGTALAAERQLAAVQVTDGVWQIASGSDAGYFRHRLELSATVFRNGFDSGVSR